MGVSEAEVQVPRPVRLRFGHAAVQHVADATGVELLHIKGAAADPSIRSADHVASDVDVLVRPDHVDRIDAALRTHGWELYSTFEHGSPFGHAQTYLHHAWGFIDIHRYFPGIRLAPEAAFDLFWADRRQVEIGGVACPVPEVDAHAVLLVLNAARSAPGMRGDVQTAWEQADEATRARRRALVERLNAEVAFAAATGGLERHRHERDYLLWKVSSEGGSRTREWWARIRAATSAREGLRIALRAPLVNVEHLGHRLGRRPTRRDVVLEFLRRPVSAVGEAARAIVRPTRRRRVMR
ncbi:nucleotidyltransferase family protein [Agromyces sp. SYSU T0242]|uniref:nucleotidyltransferase family protein n=1 Tax=Agromyces litoreus TaxID=3158561 RepID=UPI0033932E48